MTDDGRCVCMTPHLKPVIHEGHCCCVGDLDGDPIVVIDGHSVPLLACHPQAQIDLIREAHA